MRCRFHFGSSAGCTSNGYRPIERAASVDRGMSTAGWAGSAPDCATGAAVAAGGSRARSRSESSSTQRLAFRCLGATEDEEAQQGKEAAQTPKAVASACRSTSQTKTPEAIASARGSTAQTKPPSQNERRENSSANNGRVARCKERPLPRGIPEGKLLYLKQLDAPGFTLPWYDSPPFDGKQVFKGLAAGAQHGPVTQIMHTYPKGTREGLVSCCIANPMYSPTEPATGPEFVWLNAWCSNNKGGHPVGIKYCDFELVDDTDEPNMSNPLARIYSDSDSHTWS